MSFTLSVARYLGIPQVFFWTTSVCGLLGYMHYHNLVEKGYTPLKERYRNATAIIVNIFEPLEKEVLESLQVLLPKVYAIGPLHLLVKQVDDKNLEDLGSNHWKENLKCLEWLDSKKTNPVVYVNFGSEQAVLPIEFSEETKERGMLVSWCAQEKVLNHPSIGGFLTHNGWNSTLEIGVEIDNNMTRDEVESLVRELMAGKKGKEMKKKTLEWKKLVEEAAKKITGSSHMNIDKMIKEILLKLLEPQSPLQTTTKFLWLKGFPPNFKFTKPRKFQGESSSNQAIASEETGKEPMYGTDSSGKNITQEQFSQLFQLF
ncbi:hypothetical protein BC332_11539 [Capsicum chinense]|nr:hypothetical protein BC332_11539 [Capsicum chinense]